MGRLKPVAAVASNYDSLEACLASGQETVVLLDQLVGLRPDTTSLHIGAGLGRVEYHLARRVRHCYGLDVSASMVKKARRLVPYSNVTFRRTDGSGSGWPSEPLDLVYSFFVFQHVPRPTFTQYLSRIYSSLVEGGHLVFQIMVDETGSQPEPPPSHPYGLRFYSRQAVESELQTAGFTVLARTNLDGEADDGVASTGDVVFCAHKAVTSP